MRKPRLLSLISAVFVLLSVCLVNEVPAQPPPSRFIAETGLIIPGPHLKLRLIVTATGKAAVTVRFRQMAYMPDGCDADGVCKLSVSSEATSAPITLNPGEASSMELLATTYGRGSVITSSQDARVTLQIVDTVTGETQSVLIALLLP